MDTLLAVFVLAQEAAEEESTGLIDVVPGLMIWTVITFAAVLLFLRWIAFGPIQRLIDKRRDTIREALDEADRAREEARELRELTLKEREEAIAERDKILDDARQQAQTQAEQARKEAQDDLQRRLEDNQREIESQNRKLREEIRRDVVELTLIASEKVTGKVLDSEDQRRLIDDTIEEIDVKQLVSEN